MLTYMTKELNERRPRLHKYRKYYLGKQKVTFMGPQLQQDFGKQLAALSCNRCEPVVDTVLDRLVIAGFEDKDETSNHEELAKSFWDARHMDAVARQVMQEALIHGDGYLLVWPNDGVEVYSQISDQFAVTYDDDKPDEIYCAAKAWKLRDGKWRINLYFKDRLEKYKSKRPDELIPEAEVIWERHQDEGDGAWPIVYDWGRVPVFHFSVNARAGEYGRSDLDNIIPLQDSLNRTLANQAIAEEFQSYPQRWATGIQPAEVENEEGELEYVSPFDPGAGELWVSTNEQTRFGSFSAADLVQFETVINGHEMRIARTARIPIHYMTGLGSIPSGEALKTTEAPFVAKVRDRQRGFGSTWNQLINFILFLQDGVESHVEVVWQSPESRMENQLIEHAEVKQRLGVSKAQSLRELGYSDEMILAFQEENEQDIDAISAAFNEA